MKTYEYKVVPAPSKGQKARGVKRSEDKFALSIQDVMNEMALEGWEYQRSETLPHEERSGLTGKSTTFRSILVFRRQLAETSSEEESPAVSAAPVITAEKTDPVVTAPTTEEPTPAPAPKPPAEKSSIEGVVGALSRQAPEETDAEKVRPQKPQASAIPSPLRRRASQKRKQKGLAAE